MKTNGATGEMGESNITLSDYNALLSYMDRFGWQKIRRVKLNGTINQLDRIDKNIHAAIYSALFIITKNLGATKMPTVDEWINCSMSRQMNMIQC